MKFVDEVTIYVQAGKGGAGALSFRREKYIPKGGPDGGDGGNGGSVYLVATSHLNTLSDFRHKRHLKAPNGGYGMGKLRTGKKGDDLDVPVPLGTVVYDANTQEFIGDLTAVDQRLCVAQGGSHGLGNARFKSSTHRAPRKTTPGKEGDQRDLKLELKLLADVGLCGLPNAGKSSLIRSVSEATPKVASYPFTTLHPHLGVVSVGDYQSFVIADIPGLIPGASEGAGLGLQFLRHLSRTRLLLHMVDIAGIDDQEPVTAIRAIETELMNFSPELASKPRWLVFNKVDLLPEEDRAACCQAVVDELNWSAPVFQISATAYTGTTELSRQIMAYLEAES